MNQSKIKVKALNNIFSKTLGIVKIGDILEVSEEDYAKYKGDFELISSEIKTEIPHNIVKKKTKKEDDEDKGVG